MNASKSKLLELGTLTPACIWERLNLGIHVTSNHIKYLGIKIGRTSDTLSNLNYAPLITKVLEDLQRWERLPLSFCGNCHLIKMLSFSRLLYPLQMLPLLLKHSDVARLNTAFTSFLWSQKRPSIPLQKLMLPRSEGGLNFPNLRGYNLACLTRHVLDWYNSSNCFSNWRFESALAAPWHLLDFLNFPDILIEFLSGGFNL